ncbi:hypothetical protein D9M69_620980 [compost metagenome]
MELLSSSAQDWLARACTSPSVSDMALKALPPAPASALESRFFMPPQADRAAAAVMVMSR